MREGPLMAAAIYARKSTDEADVAKSVLRQLEGPTS